ncbi:Enoyl-CoA delta isomerase 2, mitochondrial [Orchesella cincta]|uniref:Enoyl-CoA delta isomerase 2, mitochondrial n=1 Tax=Orchesella cincta TaxID=48709 RepID=A0A1D2N1M2_ORCCI|nr:Enoyl-CoA delta isomerase 2, mitochondrial [Orchesella cincta]
MAFTSLRLTQRFLKNQKVLAFTGICKTVPFAVTALGLPSKCYFHHTKEYSSSSPSTSTDLLVSVQNGVRTITFNRPSQKNALTLDMFRGIIKALHESNTDENTTIVAITGTGDYFTSGIDMKSSYKKGIDNNPTEKAENRTVETQQEPKKRSRLFPFLNAILSCKKPIIALVNGRALGVGVTILGLMDGVYASESATFQTVFTKIGLIPEMSSTYTYPRIMGYCRANKILLWNEKISAKEAYECGLVSRLFTEEEFGNVKDILVEYASNPVNSLVYTKQLVRGREKELLHQICEDEQQLFDPEMAKKAKEQFLTRKTLL